MKGLLNLLAILLFFIGENVYGRIGMGIFPYFQYLILLFFLGLGELLVVKKPYHKQFVWFAIFAMAYTFLRAVIMGVEGLYWLCLLLFAAPILGYLFYSLYREKEYSSTARWLSRNMILLYLIESFIAIFERITGFLIFGWVTMDDGVIQSLGEKNEFRSTALWGHPLQNALILSTMMSFILFSHMKTKVKLILWFIGYIAILCFNTRSSMVGNAIILCIFLVSQVFSAKEGAKMKYIFIMAMALGFVTFLLFGTNMGGRLLEMGLVDDTSAQVRIDTWSLFAYFSFGGFLWGHTSKEASDFVYTAGLIATENFWIDWMFLYGLVALAIYIILMFRLLKALYRGYDWLAVFTSCSTFWLLASTNNSLTTSYVPLLFYILCVIAFSPSNEKYMQEFLYK